MPAPDKTMTEEKNAPPARKMLADYQEQLGKPFEHETRLKELIVKAGAAQCAA